MLIEEDDELYSRDHNKYSDYLIENELDIFNDVLIIKSKMVDLTCLELRESLIVEDISNFCRFIIKLHEKYGVDDYRFTEFNIKELKEIEEFNWRGRYWTGKDYDIVIEQDGIQMIITIIDINK